MNLDEEVNCLRKIYFTPENELNIPHDNFKEILSDLCRNFVKKYQRNTHTDLTLLSTDLKEVLKKIQIYSQYTVETIAKYETLKRLQTLVRSLAEGQSLILNYLSNVVTQYIEDRNKNFQKIEAMTQRIYERCQTCGDPLKRSQLENLQIQMGMKFRDMYSYFQRDFSQINRLSEEAELILKKKSLKIEEIGQQEYIHKFQKIQQNMSGTIQHVTQSLDNIVAFQQKFNEIREHQYQVSKKERQNMENSEKFNSNIYAMNMSKHFYNLIKALEEKLNKIKHYFKISNDKDTQTYNQFNECKPERVIQLKELHAKAEVQKRQAQIYNNSLQQQLIQVKNKAKIIEQTYTMMKTQKQKCDQRIKVLEVDLELKNNRQAIKRKRSSTESLEKIIQKVKESQISLSTNKNNSGYPEQIQQEDESTENDLVGEDTSKSIMDGIVDFLNIKSDNSKNSRKQSKIAYSFNYGSHKKQGEIFEPLNIKQPTIKFINENEPKRQSSFQKQVKQSRKSKEKEKQPKSLKNQIQENDKIIEEEYEHREPIQIIKKPKKSSVKSIRNKSVSRKSIAQQRKSTIKLQQSNKSIIFINRKFSINRQVSINFASLKQTDKRTAKAHRGSKVGIDRIETQRFQKEIVLNKQRSDTLHFNLKKVYTSLKNQTGAYEIASSFEVFKDKFQKFIEQISGSSLKEEKQGLSYAKLQSLKQSFNQTQQFSKTQLKTKNIFRSIDNNMNSTNKTNKDLSSSTKNSQLIENNDRPNINRKSKIKINGIFGWNKTNTECDCEEMSTKQIIKEAKQNRNSLNIVDEQNYRSLLSKIHKFNGFSSTTDFMTNKSVLENLPSLKKRHREQSFNANWRKSGQQEIQYPTEDYIFEFTEQDVKTIFTSIQNAYQWTQTSLKHRKSISLLSKDDEALHPSELGYMKHFFTKMANLHLCNKIGYQKIKLFLICPYDSVISQMAELKLIKSGSYSNAMRESLYKIIILHRNCTTKGDICKHLRYFLGKISYFERQVQEIAQDQLNK